MPNPTLVPLASRIRKLRLQEGHSQCTLADILHISQPAYEKKESGFYRFKREELEKLAQFFHIPIWEFFWDDSQLDIFAEFAKEKGYIPLADYEKEMEQYRNKIRLLEKEVEVLTEININLRADKACLHKALRFSGGVNNNSLLSSLY